jgi:hypothetical protein
MHKSINLSSHIELQTHQRQVWHKQTSYTRATYTREILSKYYSKRVHKLVQLTKKNKFV